MRHCEVPNASLYRDLEEILERSRGDLLHLRQQRIFLTGATGFIGRWLLEALFHSNDRLALQTHVTILTRNPRRFVEAAPALASRSDLQIIEGDICDETIVERVGTFDAVIHAATPASAEVNRLQPMLMLDTIILGGKNALQIASRTPGAPFLFTSSGAVYGRQPAEIQRVHEDYQGAPDVLAPETAYHEGKRVGELQCAIAAESMGVSAKIARLFAFIGPFLPLDRHFAAGNFIRDALTNDAIKVRGDGTTIRSYLYASEMIMALLAVLVRGATCRAYNVGSDRAITIAALAQTISAASLRRPPVMIEKAPAVYRSHDRYVPSIARISEELGFSSAIGLEEAVRRTLAFYEELS